MRSTAISALALAMASGASLAQIPDEDARFNAATQAVRDRNFRLAITLFQPLAEADIPDAQFNLAVLLREGRGLPQNHVEALYWSTLSLLSDGNYAKDLVDQLIVSLPPTARADVVERLLARLKAQAEAGQTDAPRKLARVYTELMAAPDMRLAYIWFSICYALGDNRCLEGRADTAREIEPEDLIGVQSEASKTFATLPFSNTTSTEADPSNAQNSKLP